MHHELSYTLEFPGLMLFACLTAPTTGGATAVADAPAVLDALPAGARGAVRARGVAAHPQLQRGDRRVVRRGVRHRGPRAVESTAGPTGSSSQWQPDGGLRTRQRRPAVVRHPVTGQRCWFNQIAFLSKWTLAPEVRDYLVDVYGEDGLPFNTRFGNGDPIGEDVVALLNEVYEAHTVREPWQPGDLLLVDNIRSAHSREAYEGPREVLVGMADAGAASPMLAAGRR